MQPPLGCGLTEAQLQQLLAQLQQQPQQPAGPKRISRRKFTPDEDEALRTLVGQYGTDWNVVSQQLPPRTARQCKDRWKHYLSPDVVVGNWTESDDQLLMFKVTEIGPRWAVIAQLFPGRTDIGVKNRYISLTYAKGKNGKFAGGTPDQDLNQITLE
jgi:hypothetical protein